MYANPCVTTRRRLWSYLDSIKKCFRLPWLVTGDFNKITNISEKRRGRMHYSNSGFADWIYRNDLVDLGFTGPRYTWMTKRGIGEEIWERLDIAICSMDWRLLYIDGYVKHLPRVLSDHCPVLIQFHSNHMPNSKNKPFRFEAMWLNHKKFDEFFINNWSSYEEDTAGKIPKFTDTLKRWNKEEFGNLFHNKRKILAHIQGVQKCLSIKFSLNLSRLEDSLLAKYSEILKQEEMFWKQKSRNLWLKECRRCVFITVPCE